MKVNELVIELPVVVPEVVPLVVLLVVPDVEEAVVELPELLLFFEHDSKIINPEIRENEVSNNCLRIVLNF